MQQVILNVLTNSLQACLQGLEDGGDITISGYRQGKWIILRVQDTGPGISAEMEKLLFDPFQTSKARGAGLGLAVCKKIIDRCGGSIEVKNRLKTGAECTICLPAAASSNDGDRQ